MNQHSLALQEGSRLQEYVIQGTLGYGGFGITYRAHDTLLDKVVAIKEYLPSELAVRIEGSTVVARSDSDRAGFEWGRQRFLDEARTLARFDHPNIIRIYRFFEQNGTGYIVMEFIDGRPLADVLSDYGPQLESEINAWLWPVLDGLKVVHEANFLHRDIKPHNIMIRKNGSPVLLDFGAARAAMGGHTRSITSILTPGYAPLEQYQTRGNQGPWTDIYALGAVAYCCMAGKKPMDALDRVIDDTIQPPDSDPTRPYSRALVNGVMTALNVREDDRPKDIDQWTSMLRNQDDGATVLMRPNEPAPDETTGPPGRPAGSRQGADGESATKSRRPLVLAALVLLGIAVAGFWQWDSFKPDPVDPLPPESSQTNGSTVQTPEAAPSPEPAVQVAEDVGVETTAMEEPSTGESVVQQGEAGDSAEVPDPPATGPTNSGTDAESERFALTIVPEPSDADIRLLNVDETYRPGILLKPGRYEVEVARQGYRSVTRTLEIFDQARSIPIALRPEQTGQPVARPSPDLSPQQADDSSMPLNTGLAPGLVIVTACDDKSPIQSVEPRFPARALARGLEGRVTLEFTVDRDGAVIDPKVRTAEPAGFFEEAALDAISQFRYRPNTIGGQLHPCLSTQVLRWEISQSADQS